jgi:DmsE family decaheme c-type cytochrome
MLVQGQPACANDGSVDARGMQSVLAGVQTAWQGERASPHDALVNIAEYAETLGLPVSAETDKTMDSGPAAAHSDEFYAAHRGLIKPSEAAQPLKMADASAAHAGIHDEAVSALIEYAQQIGRAEPRLMLAEAGMAKAKAVGQTAQLPVKFVSSEATYIGAQACQSCHLVQAAAFNQTLMGKIFRNPRNAQEKVGCEACHGPGSAHLKAVGCASCHGDGGITTRSGIPSLAGENPEYLVPAMKAYVNGQRHHGLMKAVLSGVSDAEFNKIAAYYAAQPPARAQTPLVGDPSGGAAATALCAGCHGAQGISPVPAFPNLAGQDSQYLGDALSQYKHGSRSKAIACASCHGSGGISKRTGMPSLVGLDPQYLVSAMKAYAGGQRNHNIMKVLLSGLEEAELNNIAIFYARQTPARALTPLIGDPSAGKAASAACAGCHGEEGVSSNPMWPSLAGQDARYLADELRAYKTGSRSNATMQALAAPLDDRTINNIASYYASLQPAKPNLTDAMQAAPATREPVVVRNGLVADLDERTINNIASYYASLQPAKPNLTDAMQAAPATREPVVVRNGLVADLDERTINNIASYYATLIPAQPGGASRAPARAVPARIGTAINTDGRSLEILSFRLDDATHTVDEFNDVCLGCHEKGDRTLWRGSAHDTRGVACVSCHTLMRNVTPRYQLAQLTEMDTCFQCHKNKRAEMWRSSHMPVREGKMTCSSCHNPHGSFGEALLKTATVNDACYKCHAEKRGPLLWEHAPVRENCLNCHDPHGSMQDAMLKVSRPRLCQQCHTAADHPGNPANPRAIYAIGAACSNCHVKIHGSNSPAGAAFVR